MSHDENAFRTQSLHLSQKGSLANLFENSNKAPFVRQPTLDVFRVEELASSFRTDGHQSRQMPALAGANQFKFSRRYHDLFNPCS